MLTYSGRLKGRWQGLQHWQEHPAQLNTAIKLSCALKTVSKTQPDLEPIHQLFYLTDIFYGETCPDFKYGNTLELVECCLLEDHSGFMAVIDPTVCCPKKVWQQLTNLMGVYSIFSQPTPPLSVDYICTLHKQVMTGLLPEEALGHYRTKHAKPAGSSFVYAPPSEIEARLRVLIDFVNNTSTSTNWDQVKLAALFMAEFLAIHPFSNGNGRLARLLLSLLLKDLFLVPFTFTSTSRSKYIEVLEHSNHQPPQALINFIVEQAHAFAMNVQYAALAPE